MLLGRSGTPSTMSITCGHGASSDRLVEDPSAESVANVAQLRGRPAASICTMCRTVWLAAAT
eukprot:scaffold11187_cov30-Tisochrysis_lutea.AAC.12